MSNSTEEPYESRSVPLCQRDRMFRKHHGWVRTKRCGFCHRSSHLDELGITGQPLRIAPPRSRLTWYCCVQCAKHMDTSRPGWARRAPGDPTGAVWDYVPEWMEALDRPPAPPTPKKDEPPPPPAPPLHMRPTAPVPIYQPEFVSMGPIHSWAEDGDLKFGSF